jgi:uncharacterized protein YecT (DUF1311 family)
MNTNDNQNWIDRGVAELQSRNSSTAGLVAAQEFALQSWQGEVARLFSELLTMVPDSVSAEVCLSQKAWERYRDAEFTTSDTIFGQFRAREYAELSVMSKIAIVRGRAEQISRYIEDIQSNGSMRMLVTSCCATELTVLQKYLDSVCRQLLDSLPLEAIGRLGASQPAWKEFRDLEFDTSDSIYASINSPCCVNLAVASRLSIVRARTLKLTAYLEMIRISCPTSSDLVD